MDLAEIQTWTNAAGAAKMQILRGLFHEEYAPLEVTQLAKLSTLMHMDGYQIPNTTNAMLAVLHCLEEAGAIETSEDESQTLLVRVNNGSR